MKQVITIGADGSVSGLQVKPGKGFDLRCLGKAEIKRASEVIWDANSQMWKVELREGAGVYCGRMLDMFLAEESLGVDWWDLLGDTWVVTTTPIKLRNEPEYDSKNELVLQFQDYDDAVKAEIAVLNGLRLQGKLS
jgi:hypothetical protein